MSKIITLQNIKPVKGSRKKPKVVGRGLARKGSYSGRGVKGQRARSGGRAGLQLKGMRKLMLSMPKKRGFTSIDAATKAEVVNLDVINKHFVDGASVTPAILAKKGLISGAGVKVKILGKGELERKIMVAGCAVSESAKDKILTAGGQIKP